MNTVLPDAPRRWYREAMVWLLIAIPASAFGAGLITLLLAYRGADPEVPRTAETAAVGPR